MSATLPKNEHSGKWVLYSFLGFFAVFCTVDVYFVYTALNTHTGVVTKQSYYKGLDYNKTLAEARAQKDSGTQGKIVYENGNVRFTLHDAEAKPIAGATVMAYFAIPTHDTHDFSIPLPDQGKGVYATNNLILPAKGLWTVRIEAQWKQQHYKTSLTFTTR